MNITNPITYSNTTCECNICLEETDTYTKFCKCSVKTCMDCFYKLINIGDRVLCDCCATDATNSSYLKLLLKCPLCRKLTTSPLNAEVMKNLKITDKMMVKYILEYNASYKLAEYESDIDSNFSEDSDDDDVYDDGYSRRYRITGFPYPKISREDLINTMIVMGLRHLFNF